jgi:hypothetical protein
MEQLDTKPLQCDSCGSQEACICYSAPVFAYVKDGTLTKVVVSDEETRFSGVVRCLICDRFWLLDEEPELGLWPAWEFGH